VEDGAEVEAGTDPLDGSDDISESTDTGDTGETGEDTGERGDTAEPDPDNNANAEGDLMPDPAADKAGCGCAAPNANGGGLVAGIFAAALALVGRRRRN
jgi:MYXO-CTERM domain-containing protein